MIKNEKLRSLSAEIILGNRTKILDTIPVNSSNIENIFLNYLNYENFKNKKSISNILNSYLKNTSFKKNRVKGIYIAEKKIHLFGSVFELPPFVIFDYGMTEECCYCGEPHQKFIFLSNSFSIFVDFSPAEGEYFFLDPSLFWYGPEHFWEGAIKAEMKYTTQEEAVSNFVGKAWSLSSKITEKDTIDMKINRFHDDLFYVEYFIKNNLKNKMDKKLSIDSIHFSDGWIENDGEEIKKIHPFVVIMIKDDKGEEKYIIAFEGEIVYYKYCTLRSKPIECGENAFFNK